MQVNEATGEVTAELAGKTFRFHATFPRMAALQAALDVRGLGAMFSMIQQGDARAIYHGLKCLCSSGNVDQFDKMVMIKVLPDATAAIIAALGAALPEPEQDAGNADATTAEKKTPRPGRAIAH